MGQSDLCTLALIHQNLGDSELLSLDDRLSFTSMNRSPRVCLAVVKKFRAVLTSDVTSLKDLVPLNESLQWASRVSLSANLVPNMLRNVHNVISESQCIEKPILWEYSIQD